MGFFFKALVAIVAADAIDRQVRSRPTRYWYPAEGKNVKQVQEWLGHADPGFTLRTYVHLLDEGLGDADFLDEAVTADPSRVNAGSTEGPQTAGNTRTAESADMAL